MTLVFQLINSIIGLAILIGIPYLIIRKIYKTKELQSRLRRIEDELERMASDED